MKDNKFTTLVKALKNYGVLETCKLIISYLKARKGKILILFALAKPLPSNRARENAKGHTFKFASLEELEKIRIDLSHDLDNQPSKNDIDLVRSGKARCMLQLDGDKLAGYTWVWNSHLAYIIQGFHLNLPDDTLYNFKGYTPKEYRGFGFQSIRHLKLLDLLKVEGVNRLFGYVDQINPRSLHGVRKSGYKKVGVLKVFDARNEKIQFNLTLDKTFWVEKARM